MADLRRPPQSPATGWVNEDVFAVSKPECRIHGGKGEKEDERDGPLSFTLTDSDLLDCPICIHPLSAPVYQCENGHIICSSCCSKIVNRKCPSCSSRTMGQIRCRAIEKVIESVQVACKYTKYGCTQKLQYINREEHLAKCQFSPHIFDCPLPTCNFAGSYTALRSHITCDHLAAATSFFLDEYFYVVVEKSQRCAILRCRNDEDYDIYVLNNFSYFHGSTVNVSLVAPSHISMPCYDLMADESGQMFSLHSSADCIQKKVNRPHGKKTLLVPNRVFNDGELVLKVRISRAFCGQRHPGTYYDRPQEGAPAPGTFLKGA